LYKVELEGEITYVGCPRTEKEQCGYGLTLKLNGFMTGTAALNFITNGGWGKGSTKPSNESRCGTRDAFIRSFFAACILYDQDSEKAAIKESLERDLRLSLTECEWGNLSAEAAASAKEDLGFLGISAAQMLILQQNCLTANVDVANIAARNVNANYAKVVGGAWDAESWDIAITAALPFGVQRLMEKHGLRFKKARRGAQTS